MLPKCFISRSCLDEHTADARIVEMFSRSICFLTLSTCTMAIRSTLVHVHESTSYVIIWFCTGNSINPLNPKIANWHTVS